MMNYTIFQTYFSEDQKSHLDQDFEPFDNTANLHPEFREYWVNLKVRDIAVKRGLEAWGNFSQRFFLKMGGLTGAAVHQIIKDNPGYDVYFFNYDTRIVMVNYNLWEQGVRHHVHLLTIMEEILPIMGVDTSVIYQPMGFDTWFSACTCIASKDFWDGYLSLVDNFLRAVPKLSIQTHKLLCSGANYAPDRSLWYFPFIQERLFSTYILLNKDSLKVLPYHRDKELWIAQEGYSKLHALKESGIKNKDQSILYSWAQLRNHYEPPPDDMAKVWIPYLWK